MSWKTDRFDPYKAFQQGQRLPVAEYEAPCAECGAFFTTHRPERRFCSVTCRVAEWRRGHPVVRHIAPEWLEVLTP